MGLRDTEEQLDACREQSLRDEETIASLRARLDERESRLADLEEDLTGERATTRDLIEAIRLTQEYTQLPAIEGWSWFDALRRHAPAIAEQLREHWETHPRGTEDALADRDRQIAELEHDLARAESALADRLQHDAHARPTGHTLDRGQLFDAVAARIDALIDEHDEHIPNRATGALVDEIVALVQPVDGVLLTAEEAALAVRACRHSAESIRAVLDVDPTRLHPDVAPYAERLTDLADRLQERA